MSMHLIELRSDVLCFTTFYLHARTFVVLNVYLSVLMTNSSDPNSKSSFDAFIMNSRVLLFIKLFLLLLLLLLMRQYKLWSHFQDRRFLRATGWRLLDLRTKDKGK